MCGSKFLGYMQVIYSPKHLLKYQYWENRIEKCMSRKHFAYMLSRKRRYLSNSNNYFIFRSYLAMSKQISPRITSHIQCRVQEIKLSRRFTNFIFLNRFQEIVPLMYKIINSPTSIIPSFTIQVHYRSFYSTLISHNGIYNLSAMKSDTKQTSKFSLSLVLFQ